MNMFGNDATIARQEGRYDDALRLLRAQYDDIVRHPEGNRTAYFITIVECSLLAEDYLPAHEALVVARDEQVLLLLAGEEIFGDPSGAMPQSRFHVIVEMNDILKDSRSTYDLFVQLNSLLPALARREAFLALPSVVDAGDFGLAERYLSDPSERVDALNDLADHVALFPPPGAAPRLLAELSNFSNDLRLKVAVLEGRGRIRDAQRLRDEAVAGLARNEIRALCIREFAAPGTINREMTDHRCAQEACVKAVDKIALSSRASRG